ncbi:hypothetical protein HZB02_03315 [Candidatus Woesearchaeota archaeon]|nr:hypothetical protein [Candidatus Woesearchaeota archaeon]
MQCPTHPVNINKRKIVHCDRLSFRWKPNPKGYFLIKIEKGNICVGFVNQQHRMLYEFRGNDPDKIAKEIARRRLCTLEHMAYLGQEVHRAFHCLSERKRFVQR